MEVTFLINLYDSDGDLIDNGIYLEINKSTIIKLKNKEELDTLISKLNTIKVEISENYKCE